MPDCRLPAALHYVDDNQPGLSRRRRGERFLYFDALARQVRDAAPQARIVALVIPPAYTEVWICSEPLGHLQATGRDTQGRKQYRYHQQWREQHDQYTYERLLVFAEALPALRKRLAWNPTAKLGARWRQSYARSPTAWAIRRPFAGAAISTVHCSSISSSAAWPSCCGCTSARG